MQRLRTLVAALLLTSLSAVRAAESNSPNIVVNCYRRSFEPIPCVISATTPRD